MYSRYILVAAYCVHVLCTPLRVRRDYSNAAKRFLLMDLLDVVRFTTKHIEAGAAMRKEAYGCKFVPPRFFAPARGSSISSRQTLLMRRQGLLSLAYFYVHTSLSLILIQS